MWHCHPITQRWSLCLCPRNLGWPGHVLTDRMQQRKGCEGPGGLKRPCGACCPSPAALPWAVHPCKGSCQPPGGRGRAENWGCPQTGHTHANHQPRCQPSCPADPPAECRPMSEQITSRGTARPPTEPQEKRNHCFKSPGFGGGWLLSSSSKHHSVKGITNYYCPCPAGECPSCLSDGKSEGKAIPSLNQCDHFSCLLTFGLRALKPVCNYDLIGEFGGLNEKTTKACYWTL